MGNYPTTQASFECSSVPTVKPSNVLLVQPSKNPSTKTSYTRTSSSRPTTMSSDLHSFSTSKDPTQSFRPSSNTVSTISDTYGQIIILNFNSLPTRTTNVMTHVQRKSFCSNKTMA